MRIHNNPKELPMTEYGQLNHHRYSSRWGHKAARRRCERCSCKSNDNVPLVGPRMGKELRSGS